MNTNKTYNFSYKFKNTSYNYSITIDLSLFKEGADALFFINKPNACLAQITIGDFSIILRPIGNCLLIDEHQGKTYNNTLPDYLYDLLDINAEYNLDNIGISVLERNHFEFILCKNENDLLKEYSIDFHKHLTCLDSSLESFIEELKSTAIFFIQEDFLSSFDDSSDEDFIPCYALDDFEDFTETPSTEVLYSSPII